MHGRHSSCKVSQRAWAWKQEVSEPQQTAVSAQRVLASNWPHAEQLILTLMHAGGCRDRSTLVIYWQLG